MEETAFIFSWAGMLFDISIAFLLFSKKLRPLGYLAVVAFHLLTWLLFPIGVFPWVMIGVTLIFFSADWHKRLWEIVWSSRFRVYSFGSIGNKTASNKITTPNYKLLTINYGLLSLLAIHFTLQLLVPLRHHLSDDNLYWTENGYRFSWRVMLMEKTGYLEFRVRNIATQKESIVQTGEYFSAFQQRQLVTQPDMILQAANVIAKDYENRGIQVEVYADSFASLNGEKHRPFVNPTVNLASLKNDQKRDWIVQYD